MGAGVDPAVASSRLVRGQPTHHLRCIATHPHGVTSKKRTPRPSLGAKSSGRRAGSESLDTLEWRSRPLRSGRWAEGQMSWKRARGKDLVFQCFSCRNRYPTPTCRYSALALRTMSIDGYRIARLGSLCRQLLTAGDGEEEEEEVAVFFFFFEATPLGALPAVVVFFFVGGGGIFSFSSSKSSASSSLSFSFLFAFPPFRPSNESSSASAFLRLFAEADAATDSASSLFF